MTTDAGRLRLVVRWIGRNECCSTSRAPQCAPCVLPASARLENDLRTLRHAHPGVPWLGWLPSHLPKKRIPHGHPTISHLTTTGRTNHFAIVSYITLRLRELATIN